MKWCQINAIDRKSGTYGGGHYHKSANELFYIASGSGKVVCIKRDLGVRSNLDFFSGECFLIEPNEQHYFYFRTDTTLIALYDIPYTPESPDTFVDSVLPNTLLVFSDINS
jgi:mannose-6-phosphate isomerase-like protein (cupin superfamily)